MSSSARRDASIAANRAAGSVIMRCIIGRPTSGIAPMRVRVSGSISPDPATASMSTVSIAPQITTVKLGSICTIPVRGNGR